MLELVLCLSNWVLILCTYIFCADWNEMIKLRDFETRIGEQRRQLGDLNFS